jgi:steroid delta-isomerase-like uncharacterized protein
MTRVEASIDINAPVEEVFAFASDWRRWEDWWEGVSRFRPTTELARGNGTRYAYKAWVAGVTLNLETEIHDFVENVGWRGEVIKGPPHTTQWVFEAKDNATRLTYILEYRLPVPVLGVLLDSLLMRPGWQRRLENSLENLRLHFERQVLPTDAKALAEQENKAIVNRFGEASNAKNFDAIRELLAPDFVRHCQATPEVVVRNREEFLQYLKTDAAIVPDSRQTVQHLVAEGDLVAFWVNYEGMQEGQMGPFPPSHKRMQLDISGIFRIHNGKLAELWVTWNNLAALVQLGHFPPPPTAQK